MSSFESFPLIIGWELTLACNLRCLHCASSAGAARSDELSEKEALLICDQFPELLVQEVVFTGGEPLLSPLWMPLARRLRESGILAGMVTNGTIVTAEVIRQFRETGIGAIAVSIDGMRQTHDRMRGKTGLHDRLLDGIRRLLDSGIEITLITTVNAHNLGELEAMEHQFRSMGIKRWQLQPLFVFGRSRQQTEMQLSAQQYLQLGRFIHDRQKSAEPSGMQIMGADGVGYFSELDTHDTVPWTGCSAGVSTCGIMSNGLVKGCLSWPDSMIEGDLRQDSLWSVWFREGAFSDTRSYTADDMKETCRGCAMAEECGGGCTTMSIAYTGKPHANPYCFRHMESAGAAGSSPR
ncbi:MAG: radical SAM protein [Chlorobiaceae bacterium]|nr:radical SAM protein [Chlorobiaceae bacterium]